MKLPEWLNKTIHVAQCYLAVVSTIWCHPVVCVALLTYFYLYQTNEERNMKRLENRYDEAFQELGEGLVGIAIGIGTILIYEVLT